MKKLNEIREITKLAKMKPDMEFEKIKLVEAILSDKMLKAANSGLSECTLSLLSDEEIKLLTSYFLELEAEGYTVTVHPRSLLFNKVTISWG